MAVRGSGYERVERDEYNTPNWCSRCVVDDLESQGWLPLIPFGQSEPAGIWEPAAGLGQMSGYLASRGYETFATDIHGRPNCYIHDFLGGELQPVLMPSKVRGIFTNPPYKHADAFVERALSIMKEREGIVAMLLPVDWDSAAGRRHLFADLQGWRRRKLTFLNRIIWIERPDGGESSSENHAWFIWKFEPRANWQHGELAYCAMNAEERREASESKARRRATWRRHTSKKWNELTPRERAVIVEAIEAEQRAAA